MSAFENYKNIVNQRSGEFGNKYRYILSGKDLYQAFSESQADLGYELRKEVKRDRFVMNSAKMEHMIIDLICKELEKMDQELCNIVSQDITNSVTNALNSITVGVNNKFESGNYRISTPNLGHKLGKVLGKAVKKAVKETLTQYDYDHL